MNENDKPISFKGPGKVGRAEAAEAAKCGLLLEIAIEAARPSLEMAAAESANRYLDTIATLPPFSGFLAGLALRLALALVEDRGRAWPVVVSVSRWLWRRLVNAVGRLASRFGFLPR